MTEKEFSELKPGDKVKIVSERPKHLLFVSWVKAMGKYLGKVSTVYDKYETYLTTEENDYLWDRNMIDHKLTAEELAELDKKSDCDRTECCPNDEETEPPMPIKYFLFVEDGSIVEETKNDIEQRNPEIKVVVYRQGARVPELKEITK